MTTTLEELSPLLFKQYDELPWISHKSRNNIQLEIDQKIINITIEMERIKNYVPKTEIVFSGSAFTNTANVNVNPPILRVMQTVHNHFRNLVRPDPSNGGQNKSVFDFILINGQRL